MKTRLFLLLITTLLLTFITFPLMANELLTFDNVISGNTFYGSAQSAKTGKYWSFSISLYHLSDNQNEFEGIITWPILSSVHNIKGNLFPNSKNGKLKLTFKEYKIIEKGRAHLNVKYNLTLMDDKIVGTYKDPKGDYGTILIIPKFNNGELFNLQSELYSSKKFIGRINYNNGSSTPITLTFDNKNATELQDFTGEIEFKNSNTKNEFYGAFKYDMLVINVSKTEKYKLYYENGMMKGSIYSNRKNIGSITFKIN